MQADPIRDIAAAPAAGVDALSSRDFGRIADLVGRVAGIRLPATKQLMVEGRVRKRVKALGMRGFKEYCAFLFEGGGLQQELSPLIDVITTNKTDFFREPEHFRLLADRLVPALLENRRAQRQPMLKVWSAASSTGAEAYTIAMVLDDLVQRRGGFRFAALGTDICSDVLAQAERAVYPSAMAAPIPPAMQDRYLMRSRRAGAQLVRVAPELRRHVRFARMNLMEKRYPIDREVDVIFLRNVLIYFDRADQAAVIDRLVGHLRPGGFLILGLSETMVSDVSPLRQVAPAVFEKL